MLFTFFDAEVIKSGDASCGQNIMQPANKIKLHMLSCQKHLFQLPEDIVYLNCAYMSPLLRSVEEAGIKGISRKRNPASIKAEDFFNGAEEIRLKIGAIINAAPGQIAIIPSSSYGLKSVVNNLPVNSGKYA